MKWALYTENTTKHIHMYRMYLYIYVFFCFLFVCFLLFSVTTHVQSNEANKLMLSLQASNSVKTNKGIEVLQRFKIQNFKYILYNILMRHAMPKHFSTSLCILYIFSISAYIIISYNYKCNKDQSCMWVYTYRYTRGDP